MRAPSTVTSRRWVNPGTDDDRTAGGVESLGDCSVRTATRPQSM